VLFLLLSTPALAGKGGNAEKDSIDRPGWGYGDSNHNHLGPPGHGEERPGWGYGDTNHPHWGPPGQSNK
jgi:hypothetical protein